MVKGIFCFSSFKLLMSTISVFSGVNRLMRESARALAVSKAVRQGMPKRAALRRIFTLSRAGLRPLAEVEIT